MKDQALKPQWFQILLAVADRDLHGYAIMTDVLERTGGRMRLWPGMLYGSLKRMADAGLIREVPPPPDAPADAMERHFYRIAPAGQRALAAETERLAAYVATARAKQVGGTVK